MFILCIEHIIDSVHYGGRKAKIILTAYSIYYTCSDDGEQSNDSVYVLKCINNSDVNFDSTILEALHIIYAAFCITNYTTIYEALDHIYNTRRYVPRI